MPRTVARAVSALPAGDCDRYLPASTTGEYRVKLRTIAATATAVLLPLTAACGSDDDGGPKGKPSKTAKSKHGDDCGPDSDLSQEEWQKKCAPKEQDRTLKAGQAYKFDDGLSVTVVKAAKVDPSQAEPDETPFRLHIKFHNGGKQRISLDDFSTFVEGATRGGEAASTVFDDEGSEEITGKLAPGVTATKTEDLVIDKKYGNKLVVTLQYSESETGAGDFPEAAVTIR